MAIQEGLPQSLLYYLPLAKAISLLLTGKEITELSMPLPDIKVFRDKVNRLGEETVCAQTDPRVWRDAVLLAETTEINDDSAAIDPVLFRLTLMVSEMALSFETLLLDVEPTETLTGRLSEDGLRISNGKFVPATYFAYRMAEYVGLSFGMAQAVWSGLLDVASKNRTNLFIVVIDASTGKEALVSLVELS